MQLDITNSNFDMVVDNIASGLDPSASNYITSSSYANGALVRVTGDIGTTSGQRVVNVSNISTTPTTRRCVYNNNYYYIINYIINNLV